MLAALQAAAPVLATALAWLLPTLRAAFWGVFWALRLGVYAVLVWTAWENIIEEQGAPQPSKHKAKRRHSGSGSSVLSAEVLKEHDAAEAAAAAPGGGAGRRARRRRPRSPSELSSESHDSIEDWSIWDAESEASSEESTEEAAALEAPQTPAAARTAQTAPLAKLASAAARTAPVTVQPVATPPAQQTSVADKVLPDELAAVAADQDEKEALAGATLASDTTAAAAAAGDAAAEAAAGRRTKHKKHKKPWLNRKIESMLKPYTSKYAGAGYMVYKGFSRMGQRMERSSAVLGKQLNGAIRSSGAEAVAEAEGLLKKWIKFFGVLAFLTIALMPLPSVHVTLVAGG